MSKQCMKCNGEREIGRRLCKDCYNRKRRERITNIDRRRELGRESYQRHRDRRIKEVVQYQKENKEKHKEWSLKHRKKVVKKFSEWKSTLSCSKCGENHIACLEFHHVNPSKKEGLITRMRFSPRKLEEELKKCIVLCSNCHRKLHYNLKTKNQDHVRTKTEGVNQQTNQQDSCKAE